jgi:organic radical activating enzyme
MTTNKITFFDKVNLAKDKLGKISPTMCMAKWLQVSIHLPAGLTQSCYHPPTHPIPLSELKHNVKALHNTSEKFDQRRQMLNGERPSGCQYCWNIEDAPSTGLNISDRHYRSAEDWAQEAWDEVVENPFDYNINPRYVEVNFNQACNFKCAYCSPHLSTAWEKEHKEFGNFNMPEGVWNHDIDNLRKQQLMPIVGKNSENPYVMAFWQWWPELYKTLRVFRMTGGEPLMDKNTFKILDYVNEHPNASIELSITSNLCPPDPALFDTFIEKIQKIEEVRYWEDKEKFNTTNNNYTYVNPAAKHFTLFISIDSVGTHAEYIRNGLDYSTLLNNAKRFLRETDGTDISFINTFNILSIPRIKDFFQMILDLRIEFGYDKQDVKLKGPNGYTLHDYYGKRLRVLFDIPYLIIPDWLSIQNAAKYPGLIKHMEDALQFMIDNKEGVHISNSHGFKDHEIEKHRRNIVWLKQGVEHVADKELAKRRSSFWMYFNEIDKRRNSNFIDIFPEMVSWWEDCEKDYIAYIAENERKE